MTKQMLMIFAVCLAACGEGGPPLPSEMMQARRVDLKVQTGGNARNMVGYLYSLGNPGRRPLQVALHGASYNHMYWVGPTVNGVSYDYAAYLVATTDVLTVDQLGTGESELPDADGNSLTIEESANILKQVVEQTKTAGGPFVTPYTTVYLVGHSVGAAIAIYTQASFHVADGLVVSGYIHSPHMLPPAASPAVVSLILMQPYPKYPDFLREALFYNKDGADPDVIQYDTLSMSSQMARSQVVIGLNGFMNPNNTHVQALTGPVFLWTGDKDQLYPGTLTDMDKMYYTKADLTMYVEPEAGHALNLHPNAPQAWSALTAWFRAR